MKRIYLIFLLSINFYLSTLIYQPLKSQEIVWQNVIGGAGQDFLRTMNQTADGGFICGGGSDSNSSGDKTENSRGQTDYWVVKLNSSGNVEWDKTIGGMGQDYLKSIIQTPDGGYICAGYSNSVISGDKTEANMGANDYWIVKLDALGTIQWQNTIGGSDEDVLSVIVNAPDGGFVCAGYSQSQISADKTDTSNGGFDYWILKLDANGLIQWQQVIGGTGPDYLNTFVSTGDGGYICGGSSGSGIAADKSEVCQGAIDYWIVKIDSIGNIQWQNTIGGSSYDDLYSINEIPGGGYICGGYSKSPVSGDKTEPNTGFLDDMWVMKLDNSGNILWQNVIGGAGNDLLLDVHPDYDSGFICTGTSFNSGLGIGGDHTEMPLGGGDIWIVKLDASGSILWRNLVGGIGGERGFTGLTLMNGDYVIGGYSDSPLSYDKTEASQGNTDYWILKLTSNFNLITGNLFFDMNSNTVQEAGESPIKQQSVSEITSGHFAFSDTLGKYSIAVLDTGVFTVLAPLINYFSQAPATHNAFFNTTQQIDSLNNFAYSQAGTFNDLCITITPVGRFRSGLNATYIINYSNVGTTILSPTIIFYPDTSITFSASIPAPSAVTADSTVWNLGPLDPFQTGQILVTSIVNQGIPNGTLINSGVVIEPIAGDANPICNQSFWEILTIGSWDPNDILVSYDTLTTTHVSNGQFLDYIIRFQNTGNDTAFTVKIINPIDITKLDMSTFRYVNSSHPVTLNWITWERNMEFTFDNILLPDSNINEPESHGFVRYRIQPETDLQQGNIIENFALIYFDFNPFVQTNTAETEIVLTTSLDENLTEETIQVNLYPNPAKDEVTIVWNSKSPNAADVIFYNLYGQEVIKIRPSNAIVKNTEHTLNIATLPAGVYFVKTPESNSVKFVKL